MKKLLAKFIIWLLFSDQKVYDRVDNDEMEDWLRLTLMHKGWKSWYTLRKKAIYGKMSNGVDKEEYWKLVGRLEELQRINEVSETINDAE